MKPKALLLCVDAGNTLVKWGLHEQGKPVFDPQLGVHSQLTSAFKPFQSALPVLHDALGPLLQNPATRPKAVLLSNVLGPEFEHSLNALCAQLGIPLRVLTANSHPSIWSAYQNPATLGKDRWAACLAVVQANASKVNLLVSFGTATTLDVVIKRDQWHHLGGYIVPGIRTMLSSLNLGTAQLPDVDLELALSSSFNTWPTNTHQAIAQGVGHMQVALVQSMARQLEQEHAQAPAIWLTGGHASSMLARIPHAQLLEYAVFKGLVFNDHLHGHSGT